MPRPPISLDASVKAEVGKQSVDKLVDAVVDAFSPATESLGLLGDAVRLARVEVATTITRRAKTIAETNGLRLRAPPLKFLVPFFEAASLEDEKAAELTEMWAKLLVSAGTGFSSAHVLFARLLREMTEQEADLLRRLCEISRNGPWPNPHKIDDAEVEAKLLDCAFVASDLARRGVEIPEWAGKLREHIEQPGLLLLAVTVEARATSVESGVDHSFTPMALGREFNSISFALLESLGLIAPIFVDGEVIEGSYLIDIEGWYLTHLGAAFYWVCVEGRPPGWENGRR